MIGAKSCMFGRLQIQLFQENRLDVLEGSDAIFNCIAGTKTMIEWSTDPPTLLSRRVIDDSKPNLLRLTNVQMADNGTKVNCTVGTELKDQALLIVKRRENSSTDPFTDTEFPTTHRSSSTNETSSTKTGGLSDTVIYVIAAASCAFVIVILVIVVVVACFCCRTQEVSDEMLKDSKHTPRLSDRNPNHSYAELNLADVHHADYASLNNTPMKKEAKVSEPAHSYVNVNPKEGAATYEVNIVS